MDKNRYLQVLIGTAVLLLVNFVAAMPPRQTYHHAARAHCASTHCC